MARAWQVERQMDREEEQLSRMYADGEISQAEYNAEMRELQREARDAYLADLDDAAERVRDEWGW